MINDLEIRKFEKAYKKELKKMGSHKRSRCGKT